MKGPLNTSGLDCSPKRLREVVSPNESGEGELASKHLLGSEGQSENGRGEEIDRCPRKGHWTESQEANSDLHFVVNYQYSYGSVSVYPFVKWRHRLTDLLGFLRLKRQKQNQTIVPDTQNSP